MREEQRANTQIWSKWEYVKCFFLQILNLHSTGWSQQWNAFAQSWMPKTLSLYTFSNKQIRWMVENVRSSPIPGPAPATSATPPPPTIFLLCNTSLCLFNISSQGYISAKVYNCTRKEAKIRFTKEMQSRCHRQVVYGLHSEREGGGGWVDTFLSETQRILFTTQRSTRASPLRHSPLGL